MGRALLKGDGAVAEHGSEDLEDLGKGAGTFEGAYILDDRGCKSLQEVDHEGLQDLLLALKLFVPVQEEECRLLLDCGPGGHDAVAREEIVEYGCELVTGERLHVQLLIYAEHYVGKH